MEYKELIKNRRSIRVYQDKAIPDYVIKEILSEACLAPSSSNKQPWKFLVVTNRNLIKKLSEESKKNILVDISKNPTSIYKQYENFFKKPDANIFYNAPCIIFKLFFMLGILT